MIDQREQALAAHGYHLRARLEYLKTSQAEFVRQLNERKKVSGAAVCRWMNGRSYPSRDLLPVVLDVLQYTLAERDQYVRLWAGV